MIDRPAVRRHAVPVAVVASLLVVYGLTLARDVTFWDAGEFIAAASTLGIPHPPGTPLYILLLRTAVLLGAALGVPAAIMTSLVSALATAAACGFGAALLARGTGERAGAVAGGLAAGTMASVWLNATETEVYAGALVLALAITWAAERAGRTGTLRWTLLTGYLLVLAVPLHLSALLVAPAAIALAYHASAPSRRAAIAPALVVGAAVLCAFALGKATLAPALVALGALVVAAWFVAGWSSTADAAARVASRRPIASRAGRVVALALVVAIAASAVLVLLLRARHDPAINQGNPGTWPALLEVLSRRQYAVASLWPRQAPLWLQLGNLLLYADWQVALSLGPTIFPTPLRTTATIAFAIVALVGARAHFARDRRTAIAFGLLLLAGTVGAALYLNLKAGPSFGHGILPPGTAREARERDYFFVLGWWAWGMWAGLGAVVLARRAGAPGPVGIAFAALPLMLNWRAVDRTRLPEAALPRATAEGLLHALPPRAVLFVAGDNDSYPLWYAQRTLGMRRDVTVITTPLLPADWYRDELARRDALFAGGGAAERAWRGREAAIREIASRAAALGRPVAMAVAMPASDRALVSGRWTLSGVAYVGTPESGAPHAVTVDTAAARHWDARLRALTGGGGTHPATDGTARYMHALLGCPGLALAHHRGGAVEAMSDSLARYCNFR